MWDKCENEINVMNVLMYKCGSVVNVVNVKM